MTGCPPQAVLQPKWAPRARAPGGQHRTRAHVTAGEQWRWAARSGSNSRGDPGTGGSRRLGGV